MNQRNGTRGPLVIVIGLAIFCLSAPAQTTPGSGNVGINAGGPFDVLEVNGSSGGGNRQVNIGINQPITFGMQTPPSSANPSLFAIFGFVGAPAPADVRVLPFGVGSTLFPLCPLAPNDPRVFTLTNNLGGTTGPCTQVLGSSATPWAFNFAPGSPFPGTFALQGIITDPSATFNISITNAVVVNIVNPEIEVLYSKIAGHPTAVVPGARDLMGNPAVTEFRAFEDLIGSPDGSSWLVKGRCQLGSSLETLLMTGSGPTGSVFAQEGQPVHGGAPGELYDFFGSGVGRFNNQNDFAYSARARGGVSGTLQKVIRVIGGVGTIVIQQGDPAMGLMDLPPNPSGDELFGNSVGSVHLLDDGTVGTQDSTLTNIHSSRRPAVFYDDNAFLQANVSQVFGLDGVTPETIATLDSNEFYTTPDGAHWVAEGNLVAPSASDDVLIYDGVVVIQQASLIPGSAVTADQIFNTELLSDGDWLSRGSISGGGVWAVQNGNVVAQTGDPIITGSPESWATSFTAFHGNRGGDWVLVGRTDNASTAVDDVIVLNGTHVVAREGDPVDLDGNGIFDDDVFLGRGNDTLTAFAANDIFLTDSGVLYFFANLRDGSGNDLNSNPVFSVPLAFLRRAIVQ